MAAAMQTRSSLLDPIFGEPKEFSNKLPTYSDVFRHYRFIHHKHGFASNASSQPIIIELVTDLKNLWHQYLQFMKEPLKF